MRSSEIDLRLFNEEAADTILAHVAERDGSDRCVILGHAPSPAPRLGSASAAWCCSQLTPVRSLHGGRHGVVTAEWLVPPLVRHRLDLAPHTGCAGCPLAVGNATAAYYAQLVAANVSERGWLWPGSRRRTLPCRAHRRCGPHRRGPRRAGESDRRPRLRTRLDATRPTPPVCHRRPTQGLRGARG